MPTIKLFPDDKIVGVFRGFREGGLEFHADLVLPYRPEFQSIPMHGQYLLVQLESPDEAVLGRISSLSADGKFSSTAGEEFNIRAVSEGRVVPEDLRQQYLRYRVNMRVLGVLRSGPSGMMFVASHRRLPHVGSPIAFLSDDVLREVAGHNEDGAALGHLALGEYIYAQGAEGFTALPWMQIAAPEVMVKFPVRSLVSRRSFVFARAGFGKSNLVKLMLSNLYATQPEVEKRNGRAAAVGTVIFDPDGEYFWPDDKGRPGLCDVPALHDRIAVFTSREAPSAFYGSFIAGGTKLDLRELKASDVIGLALNPERQEQQNVLKLRGLGKGAWEELVTLVDRYRGETSDEDLARILKIDARSSTAELTAARSNIVRIVSEYHDSTSQFLLTLVQALKDGKLCIVDLSKLRGRHGLVLSSLVLRRIFEHNQDQFTKADPQTIPTIAVIEEAQSVLDERASAAAPFVEWVKEGRKYDLGAVLITQQPGSIQQELLSQGDNWFVFHLLSAGDLGKLKQANAHFSDDLLSSLLNEPIRGHGVFWSSAADKPCPVAIRALSFEDRTHVLDPDYQRGEIDVYARRQRGALLRAVRERLTTAPGGRSDTNGDSQPTLLKLASQTPGAEAELHEAGQDGDGDLHTALLAIAVRAIEQDSTTLSELRSRGKAWGGINRLIESALPHELPDRGDVAHALTPKALNHLFPRDAGGWHTFKHPTTYNRWIKAGPKP
jgi:uncharacterized protein